MAKLTRRGLKQMRTTVICDSPNAGMEPIVNGVQVEFGKFQNPAIQHRYCVELSFNDMLRLNRSIRISRVTARLTPDEFGTWLALTEKLLTE